MSDFSKAFPVILHDEGAGYVANDHGRGPSKYGITLATAKELFPDWTAETIANLTEAQAEQFYYVAFWQRYHYFYILDQDLATKVLDFGVNCGGTEAVLMLQRAVGVMPEDGILGPKTAQAVNRSNPHLLLGVFKREIENYHREVAAAHPELADRLAGWLARDAA